MINRLDIKSTKINKVSLEHYLPWEICIKKYKKYGDAKIEMGIVIQKDGNIQQTFGFRGFDLDALSDTFKNGVTIYFNNCLKSMRDGWMISLEAQRYQTQEYPQSKFSNLAAYLIDKEREESFTEYGRHFESAYYMTFVFKPEIDLKQKMTKIFFKESENAGYAKQLDEQIDNFLKETDRITGVMQDKLFIRPLDYEETIYYLHSTVSFRKHKINIPDHFLFLDSYISDERMDIGQTIKMGDYYIPILTIKDFPMETYPLIIHELNKVGVEYRWVNRYFPLGKEEALNELNKWQKKHFAGRKSLKQNITEMAMHVETHTENTGSSALQADVEQAIIDVTTDIVGLGYYNTNIMVYDKDYDKAMEKLSIVRDIIGQCGFITTEETFNAFSAFLGMTAGEPYNNIRRPLINTVNYSHIVPLSAVWSGIRFNQKTYEICGVDGPLFTASTAYGTPFYYVPNEGDLGHGAIFGPSGAGKSTLIQLTLASFLKYPDAQVFIMDKGLSALTLTLAVGGDYVNPGVHTVSFQPLANIDDKIERMWASEFIEVLLEMQGVTVIAPISIAINATLEMMSVLPKVQRTLTTFRQSCTYQDVKTGINIIHDALTPYTMDGAYGSIFDGDHNSIGLSDWVLFEMDTLMSMGQKAIGPAIMFIFHYLDSRFTGRLTYLVLDEAWVFLDHPIFENKMKSWLKELRKKNVFCWFATQEVADAAKSRIASTIIQNCPTKIYLADPKAIELAEYYRMFGLDNDEINLISMSRKKRDYYYKSVYGTRKFQLDLGPLELALFMEQPRHMVDKNGKEYYWGQFCQYLLKKKEKENIKRGFVREILEMQGIEYEKYIEGLEIEE